MLAAAFVANALLIEPLGWPISGAILFWGVGLRPRQPALRPGRGDRRSSCRFGSWYLFASASASVLPVGILKGIL